MREWRGSVDIGSDGDSENAREDEGNKSDQDIHKRPRERNKGKAPFAVFKVARVDGDGFSAAENRGVHEGEDQR